MKVEKTNDTSLPEVKIEIPETMRTEDTPKYDSLQNSTQTFHALGRFEARDGLVILRVPEEVKRINPRKYRDQIFKVPEAIDKYINMGMLKRKLAGYGTRGTDELDAALDEFGAKIVEAIDQHRKLNIKITDRMLMFKQKYEEYKRKVELMANDSQLNQAT